MSLKIILTISLQNIRETIKSKFSYIILFFVVFLLFVSMLVGIMSVNDEKIVLMDFFLATTQLSVLIFSLISTSFSIVNDIDTKRIYLILSRPVKWWEYVIGKISGIYLSSLILLIFINIACFVVLIFKGYFPDTNYLSSLAFIYFKIVIISSYTLFFSFVSTSPFTSIGISMIVWFIAHLMNEINFAINRSQTFLAQIVKYLLYFFPDFSGGLNLNFIFTTIFYIIILIVLSSCFFRKIEV